ncbi:glycosyltransferase family 39 protein [Candidatus Woesearchaeota archaeon]|nr:glycosyltransferase family 39 protein [Candidatus Woesearchaeota archaeon]
MSPPKLKLSFVFLLVFVVFGFYLRFFNIDFPSIGYHNMKENEYLVPSYYFYSGNWEGWDFLRRPYYLCGVGEIPCYFEEYPQIPVLSWLASFGWLLFGVNFWWPRFLMVLASVGTIVALYYFVRQLSRNNYVALLSSFIFAFLPLSVFFGRNFQPESPALLFAVLASYYFVKWIDEPLLKNIVLAGVFFCITALLKMTFLIVLFPLVFVFPFSRIVESSYRKHFVLFVVCFIPFLLWNGVISGLLNVSSDLSSNTLKRVDLFRIFGSEYWNQYFPTLKAYTLDNFTSWYFWLAVFGLICMLFFIRSRISRYSLGYAVALVPYLMILADYFKGHSYYQFPFLPLIAISSAFILYVFGIICYSVIRMPFVKYLPLLLLLPTISAVKERTNVQFDTIFYGLDVAGSYIQEHTGQGDAFYMVGESQSVGVCFAAKRVCPGMPRTNLSKIQLGEQLHNISYVFVHIPLGGLQMLQQYADVWAYMQSNYSLVSVGGFLRDNSLLPVYYILKKGGVWNPSSLPQGSLQDYKEYSTKHGVETLYVMSV